MQPPVTIFWFRRDLRLHDNRGLYEALTASVQVMPLFIFDTDILDPLPVDDHRVTCIYDTLYETQKHLQSQGSGMLIRKGRPVDVLTELLQKYNISAVYANCDHEPYGLARDDSIKTLLANVGIPFHLFLDHLIFQKDQVLKADGSPYIVYTPYSKQWKAMLTDQHVAYYDSESLLAGLYREEQSRFPDLSELGFRRTGLSLPVMNIGRDRIEMYDQNRDFPFVDGTSHAGLYLRFGMISIRELVKKALQWNGVFLNELIWREFYAMILWHFPAVADHSFRPEYDRINWRNDEEEFTRWKTGNTGFPMVDAGMRQLNATGYMHNRLRMITASFLTKHLLVDWRWGEAYFAGKLYDYELSSNNGGWQWSAGTGCDAAPYFRIFNPIAQQKKFDPEGEYIRRWVPDYDGMNYPGPMVDLQQARERCLRVYKAALTGKE
jgi:deoxyribodipyrimidine photo-lyase